MAKYNYGTAVNKLIDNYQEMLEILVQARLASDRVDDWKNTLNSVTNPDQTKMQIDDIYQWGIDFLLKWKCGECGETRVDDERVLAGMKCGHCAYGELYIIDEEWDTQP